MNKTITVKRSPVRPYSMVYDDILMDERVGWRARVLLAWMLGRSDGFQIHIWYIRKVFRLSEQQWVHARKEMQSAGYFLQKRIRDENGRIRWHHVVADTPVPPSPQKP